jgi:lipoprotein-anchoring transpeptidase ErfK/SrfK
MKALAISILSSKATAQALMLVALMTPAAAQTHQLVVSVPDHKLALIEDGEVKKVYPVATGRDATPSPVGSFKIVNRVKNPTYYHQGRKVEAGPLNPVGTRWIGLNEKGYGIHGTNAPASIGKSASHGCIRMAKKDLEELFEIVRPGDVVEIRSERDEETAELFGAPITGKSAQNKPVVMAAATEPLPHGQ